MIINLSQEKIVSNYFPSLRPFGTELLYVDNFKDLGHVADNKLSDAADK